MSLRIAIIPALYDTALSYTENLLAKELALAGHSVMVFTSMQGAKPGEKPGFAEEDGVRIRRSGKVLTWKNTSLPYDRAMAQDIRDFNPQAAFLMAPLHGLGYFWSKALPPECRVAASYSDIPLHRARNTWKARLKESWARKLGRRANVIYSLTQQTTQLLNQWVDAGDRPKIREVGCAVDFAALAGPDKNQGIVSFCQRWDTVLSLVTRINPDKFMDEVFLSIARHLEADPRCGLILAGCLANEASQKLRAVHAASSVAGQALLLNEVDAADVGTIFRHSQLSLWNGVSIGIYQSLACGCPALVCSQRGSAEHLIKPGQNGGWYENHTQLPQAIPALLAQRLPPEPIRRSVESYDSKVFARRWLDGLME